MSSQLASPSPAWIVRHHAPSPIHTLAFANRGQDLIAGDARGRVSITIMSTYRPYIFFQPHQEAILRADVWSGFLVTYVLKYLILDTAVIIKYAYGVCLRSEVLPFWAVAR